MLARISADKLLEWQVFEQLEPFGEDRADLRSAQIVQALYHIATARVRPDPGPLERFRILVGDWRPSETVQATVTAEKQTVKQQERMLDAWIAGSNARHARTA